MVVAKVIPKSDQYSDNIGRLVRYIERGAGEERRRDFWSKNTVAGNDAEVMDETIQEMRAVQAKNIRTRDVKTYHLIVSFRHDETPTSKEVKEITSMYVDALGYGEHQYVAGTHTNTENFHIHVAINKIHPDNFTIRTPKLDFKAIEETSRAVEKRFALTPDNGAREVREAGLVRDEVGARDFEAHTWEKSYLTDVKEHSDIIKAALATSQNWEDFHAQTAPFDIVARPRGDGMVFTTVDGREAVKASSVDRSLSKKHLVEKLGPYQVPKNLPSSKNKTDEEAAESANSTIDSTSPQAPPEQDFRPDGWSTDYAKELSGKRDFILSSVATSNGWTDLNDKLGVSELAIKPVGRTYVVGSPEGTNQIRTTRIDTQLTPANLERRLGKHPEAPVAQSQSMARRYTRKPLTRNPATSNVWRRFVGETNDPNTTPGPGSRPIQSWKQYLLLLFVIRDPLAVAIIIQQRREINLLIPKIGLPKHRPRRPNIPAAQKAMQEEWAGMKGFAYTHTHLIRNHISGHGIKENEYGQLVIPARSSAGQIVGLSYIDEDGQHTRHSGGIPPGAMHLIGDVHLTKPKQSIVIAKDYETAATIHRATGLPVAIAFDASNIDKVASRLQTKYSKSNILIAGERGPDGPLMFKAASLVGATYIEPSFPNNPDAGLEGEPKTFHDKRFLFRRGLGELQLLIQTHVNQKLDSIWVKREANRADWQEAEWAGRDHAGIKKDRQGNLMIPARDTRGYLQTYQVIKQNGHKSFSQGGLIEGTFHLIQHRPQKNMKEEAPTEIFLVREYEYGRRIHLATGRPVAIAFGTDNTEPVGHAIAKRYPNAKMTMIGESHARDRELEIAAKSIGAKFVSLEITSEVKDIKKIKSALQQAMHTQFTSITRVSKELACQWKRAPNWASPHSAAYLEKEGLKGRGVKVNSAGELMVPLRTTDGSLKSFQYIAQDGQKRLSTTKIPKGSHFLARPWNSNDPNMKKAPTEIILTTSWENAAKVNQDTGSVAAATITTENMAPVAKSLKRRYPNVKFQISVMNDDERAAVKMIARELKAEVRIKSKRSKQTPARIKPDS